MPRSVTLQNGTVLSVADKPIGEGGEGEVYEILNPAEYQSYVAKILFHDKRTHERRYKTRYMVDNPPLSTKDGNNHDFLIWPQQLLLEKNDFAGFMMPKAAGIDLEELCRVTLKPELGMEWQKFYRDNPESISLRLILCSNIAKAVNALHSTGHYVIGDLKPDNIRVKSNGLVSILDLDSCQISERGQIRFQSKMNTPQYNPPDKVKEQKDLSWDYFILGVIFYEVLCGIHPFVGTTRAPYEGFDTPEQKIQAGLFPFGSKSSFFEVVAPPHNNFKNLPDKIQTLFICCFDQGITNPAARPNTSDWINTLTAKPKILFFKADKETIIAGAEISLSWQVENADEIYINEGIGCVGSMGEILFRPRSDIKFKIVAKNIFGIVEQEIQVNTFPTPVIESLKVPMPDFSFEIQLNPISIPPPIFDVSISLTNVLLAYSLENPVKINEEFLNIKPLYEKPFSLSISAAFNKVKSKISTSK